MLLIVMDEPALVDALPVFRMELPFRIGFHRCMVLLATDKAFHEAGLLVNQFCGVILLCHQLLCQADEMI
jgi:hypothetical protein